MNHYLAQVSAAARNAASRRDWATVGRCAREILLRDDKSAEGYFLNGLAAAAAGRAQLAMKSYAATLDLDGDRYDAALELANLYCVEHRHAEAVTLASRHENRLAASPRYLHMAGTVYSRAGLADRAWPLFSRALELQPGIEQFRMSLGTCAVYLGRIDEATRIYTELLEQAPTHQRNHYQLSQLRKATDTAHIDQMRSVLSTTNLPPDRNIFLYYAIGKEFEDLGHWDEAFRYFRMAGDAVLGVADYDIRTDLELIDTIIDVCDANWLAAESAPVSAIDGGRTPIFLVGLPRSGTTLTERIISSHSRVASVDETQYLQMAIRQESGVASEEKMTPAMIRAAATRDVGIIARDYLDRLEFRLGDEPMFIDKLPFNLYYLGFIARAFPNARIVLMKRNPMDSCFAMYKQVFAAAYKFSYSLDYLGQFYVAYSRLVDHWKETIGDRIIEIEYESLVADQEGQTRRLIGELGLDFEPACLSFDRNESAITTASSVQVRQKIHKRSVNRWRHYEKQLQPLRDCLDAAGIDTA